MICSSASFLRGESRFTDTLLDLYSVHLTKHQDYDPSGLLFENIRQSKEFGVPGWIGAMVRLNDKIKRIQSFIKHCSLQNEGVKDSLLDIANYAIIALILYEETYHDDTST